MGQTEASAGLWFAGERWVRLKKDGRREREHNRLDVLVIMQKNLDPSPEFEDRADGRCDFTSHEKQFSIVFSVCLL